MIEQEKTPQTSDQNVESQAANLQTKNPGEYLFETERFEFEGRNYLADIARKGKLIVQLKNMRPENGQQIPQNPKRTVRRSRLC